jgi:hypothetical protein
MIELTEDHEVCDCIDNLILLSTPKKSNSLIIAVVHSFFIEDDTIHFPLPRTPTLQSQ